MLLAGIASLPMMRAAPTRHSPFIYLDEEPPMSPQEPTLWIYLAVAVALVLLGGAFAGLTIALMGQVRKLAPFSTQSMLEPLLPLKNLTS